MPALTAPPGNADRPRHDPWAAFRQRNFAWFAAARLFSGMATTLLQAAIAWQVYQLWHSALALALVGLVRFLPALALSLPAGAAVDSYDRKRILVLAQVAPMLSSGALLILTVAHVINVPWIYAGTFLIAIASAFEQPARQAVLPRMVSHESFPNAVTANSSVQQLAFVLGPALGGLLIAQFGIAAAYTADLSLVAAGTLTLLLTQPLRERGERRAVSWAAIREGVSFVRHRQVLLGAMTLDMFAVILGGATAMLPIYATNILHVGAQGYGLLTASQSIGAMLMGFLLVFLPPVRRTGRALLVAVTGFGLATVVFGLSRSFPLSLAAYGLTGVADQISVVMRQTTIQLATPDELRGRVSSVSSLFIGASNQVGAVESGFVAALFTATFSVVSGGLGCIGVVAGVAVAAPELRRYRIKSLPARQQRPAAESVAGD